MFSRLLSRPASSSSIPHRPPSSAAVADLRSLLATDPLFQRDDVRAWADDACLSRYLVARNYVPSHAADALRHSAKWRTQENVNAWLPAKSSHLWPIISAEAASGKMFVLPQPNKQGQAVIVMRPGLENNTTEPDKNLQYLTYTLERAAALTVDGTFVIVIDYEPGAFSIASAPSLKTSKEVLAVLQAHYPERLRKAFMFNSPSYWLPIFRLIKPFIDPVTASKSKSTISRFSISWYHVRSKVFGEPSHSLSSGVSDESGIA